MDEVLADGTCDRSEASAGASTSMSEAPPSLDDLYIKHKVSKLDTLAGLAVRYNVSVSDVKRANGLLSDTAMFAKDTLLIPRQPMGIGEDVQVLAAKIMSGYGRDPSLDTQSRRAPGTSAALQMPGSPRNRLSSYDDDDPGTPYSRRSDATDPGDVELTDFTVAGDADKGQNDVFGQHIVRRRAKQRDAQRSSPATTGRLRPAHWQAVAAQDAARQRAGQASGHNHVPRDLGATWQHITQMSKAIGASQLVQKIRKAASQPALATAQYKSFADAADAVLGSCQPGKPARRGQGMPAPAPHEPPPAVNVLPSRIKRTTKNE